MSIGRYTRTEVVSEVVFLGKLVERIAAGKIRVPRFQRDFVWKQQDMHALLDSVFQGFPIGSILVWDTEKRIDSPHACRADLSRITPGRAGQLPARRSAAGVNTGRHATVARRE